MRCWQPLPRALPAVLDRLSLGLSLPSLIVKGRWRRVRPIDRRPGLAAAVAELEGPIPQVLGVIELADAAGNLSYLPPAKADANELPMVLLLEPPKTGVGFEDLAVILKELRSAAGRAEVMDMGELPVCPLHHGSKDAEGAGGVIRGGGEGGHGNGGEGGALSPHMGGRRVN